MQDSKLLHIVKIKVDGDFEYVRYLHWFPPHVVNKIQAFYFKHDRVVAFISALLKHYYLAKILNVPQSHIRIQYDCFKRPYLMPLEHIATDIDFNISHSGNYVVMAVTMNGKVGIDIEHRPINSDVSSLKEMAQIVFSESEQLLINDNVNNFLLLWTKKEALLKAVGTGFLDELYMGTNLDLNFVQEIVFGEVKYICVSLLSSFDDKINYALSVVVPK